MLRPSCLFPAFMQTRFSDRWDRIPLALAPTTRHYGDDDSGSRFHRNIHKARAVVLEWDSALDDRKRFPMHSVVASTNMGVAAIEQSDRRRHERHLSAARKTRTRIHPQLWWFSERSRNHTRCDYAMPNACFSYCERIYLREYTRGMYRLRSLIIVMC